MPKLQNPPQGGEKYLCLTLFLTMMMAVVSAVAIIYSIVIIYVPAKTVLESKNNMEQFYGIYPVRSL